MEGVKHRRTGLLPKDICEHAAITPEVYADALIVTVELGNLSSMRPFLLKHADLYDLEAVKEKPGYARLNPKFHDDIEKAFGKAAPGGTRTKTYDIQTAEKVEETFEELESPRVLPEIVDLINAYVVADTQTPKRKAQIAVKKAAKRVASHVTSTSTKIEGSEDIGSGWVGENQA